MMLLNSSFAADSGTELEKMLPLSSFQNSHEEKYLVEWKNDQGDAVSLALLQNPSISKGFETTLWFYDRNKHYSIIARDSDLDSEGEIKYEKILINNNGTIVVQYKNKQMTKWLSWSKDKGLFLDSDSDLKNLFQLNEKDYFLIQKNSGNIAVINAKNPSEIFETEPLNLDLNITSSINSILTDRNKHDMGRYKNTNIWYPTGIKETYTLNNNLNIIAKFEGSLEFRYKQAHSHPCENGWVRSDHFFRLEFIKKINSEWERTKFEI